MPARFANRFPHPLRSRRALLAWWWRYLRQRPPPVRPPVTPPELAWIAANRHRDAVTWIGHATCLLQLGGRYLLTDPQFSRRASPLPWLGPRRTVPPAPALAQLPPLDFVLISHDHYDHLDVASVRRLAAAQPQAHFVVPSGLRCWLLRHRVQRVIELEWWQAVDVGGCMIHAVPVQHFSGRGPFDRNRRLWCGYVIECAGRRTFFAGDTGYSPDFADIAGRLGSMDLALLPIGAYAPQPVMGAMHVDPEAAVQIHLDLGARQSVAMHWGTFRLSEEPLDEPPQRLARALAERGVPAGTFQVLRHGQTLRLPAAAMAELR
ncbi:MAG: MBL fold metallo-hydrolase [Gammaproteobacteria bacterium]|nr:MBL fold metallo-hydrolase [Gammaproteobacteria bacterium]